MQLKKGDEMRRKEEPEDPVATSMALFPHFSQNPIFKYELPSLHWRRNENVGRMKKPRHGFRVLMK